MLFRSDGTVVPVDARASTKSRRATITSMPNIPAVDLPLDQLHATLPMAASGETLRPRGDFREWQVWIGFAARHPCLWQLPLRMGRAG